MYHYPKCLLYLISHSKLFCYRARDSDVPSSSKTAGEIAEGEANVPNMSYAPAAANMFIRGNMGIPTLYSRPNLICNRLSYNTCSRGSLPRLSATGSLALKTLNPRLCGDYHIIRNNLRSRPALVKVRILCTLSIKIIFGNTLHRVVTGSHKIVAIIYF